MTASHVWVLTHSDSYWSDGPIAVCASREAAKRLGATYLARKEQYSRVDADGGYHDWLDFDEHSECRTRRLTIYAYRYEVER